MHFHDMHKLLPITIAEEYNYTRPKVEEGIRLSLELIQRAEEEEDHAWIEAEEEACLVE